MSITAIIIIVAVIKGATTQQYIKLVKKNIVIIRNFNFIVRPAIYNLVHLICLNVMPLMKQ